MNRARSGSRSSPTSSKNTSSRRRGVEEMMNTKQICRDRIVGPGAAAQILPAGALRGTGRLAEGARHFGAHRRRYNRPNDLYIIISGERRWRASGIGGLKDDPAIVREDQEAGERLIDQLMENIQREDLDDIDRANGLTG